MRRIRTSISAADRTILPDERMLGSAMSCGSLWWRALRWSSGKCADHYTREHTTPLELLTPDPCYAWRSFTIYSCGKLNQIAVLIGFFKVHISVRV